jgi:type IV pilus assembly protein PilM
MSFLPFELFKKKDVIAVDIGTSSIKLVELSKKRKAPHDKLYQLKNLALTPLPPDTIVEDEIRRPEILVNTLVELFTGNKIENKNIITSLSGRSVIVKKIRLPRMEEDELADSIQWEAEQFIPFDINDVDLDFQIINYTDTEPPEMDVLLVAVKKERILQIMDIIREANLIPAIMDVDVFTIENQHELNYDSDEENCVVLMDIGAETMNINIIKRGYSVFTRDASFGGNQYTKLIQHELELDFQSAEALKLGEEVEGISPQLITPLQKSFFEDLIAEIQKSFDYFRTTNEEGNISKIYLSGGSAKLNGITSFLGEQLELDVEITNPFKKIYIDENMFNLDYINYISPMMSVGVGLALRRVNDRW